VAWSAPGLTILARMSRLLPAFLLASAPLSLACVTPRERPDAGEPADRLVSIAEKVRGMRRMPGFLPLDWDERTGKMWLEIERFDRDLLYVDSLPSGLGSNDVGLDRGQLGRERVVRFEKSGRRVLLVQQNLAFRAEQGSAAERRAV